MGFPELRVSNIFNRTSTFVLMLVLGSSVGLSGCSLSDRPMKTEEAPQSAASNLAPAQSQGVAPSSQRLQDLIVLEERGQTTLFIRFAQPINQYRHFMLPQPSRIVVDVFDSLKGAAETEIYRLDSNWLSALRITGGESSLRLTLEVAAATVPSYAIEPREGGIKIVVGSIDPSATKKRSSIIVQAGRRLDMGEPQAARPISTDAPKPSVSSAPDSLTRQKISLDFKDADIKNVFRLLAEVSGLNLVVTPDVNRRITLRLVEVPWDQAMDLIITTNGLVKEHVGNIVRISTVGALKAETDAMIAARKSKEDLESLQTVYFKVNYAKARELEGKIRPLMTKRADNALVIDERSNTIMVRDIQKSIDDVSVLVSKLDTRTPQVLIESNLIETTPSYARALGMELEFALPSGSRSSTALTPRSGPLGTAPRTTGEEGQALSGLFPGGGRVDSNLGAESPFAAALGATFSIIRNRLGPFRDINATLSAAEQEGNIKIISRPSVVTLNNVESTIASLRVLRVSLQSSTNIASGTGAAAGTAVATEQIKVGITLSVVPQVSSDGFILLNIRVKSSSLGTQSPGSVVPDELSREAISNVLVRDGETVVIGGIMKDTQQESEAGVPYLKDIPVLGWMFKRIRQQKDFEELMVFITPRLTAAGSTNLISAEQLWRDQMKITEGVQPPTYQNAP